MRNFSPQKDLLELKKLHKKIDAAEKNIRKFEKKAIKVMSQTKTRSLDLRRSRTRTLIQIGGLIEKVGITDLFDIDPGDDLQQDAECFDNVSALTGAFLEWKSLCEDDTFAQQKLLWIQRGKEYLAIDRKSEEDES